MVQTAYGENGDLGRKIGRGGGGGWGGGVVGGGGGWGVGVFGRLACGGIQLKRLGVDGTSRSLPFGGKIWLLTR